MSGANPDLMVERTAARAAALLRRPSAYLEPVGQGYAVRMSADRRRRPVLALDETVFGLLARRPGLKPRAGGGWTLAWSAPEGEAPPPGRPGFIEGEKSVAEAPGRTVTRRANLGESPIAWLARRKDSHGRPWLSPEEAAAGEKLRDDFHRAGTLGRLTMAWDAGPRSKGGRGPGLEPAERSRAAKARVAAALEAVGPGLKEILEHVCLAGTALDAAERDLGLPRRAGKMVLKL